MIAAPKGDAPLECAGGRCHHEGSERAGAKGKAGANRVKYRLKVLGNILEITHKGVCVLQRPRSAVRLLIPAASSGSHASVAAPSTDCHLYQ